MDIASFAIEEFLPTEEVTKLQQRRWQSQRSYVIDKSKFFKNLWNGIQVPERLEEIPELPLCDKAMLRESQLNSPPFGDYLATDPSSVVRLHRTSGTTGQAMNAAQTRADVDQTARVGARSYRASGLKVQDRVVHCLNYQMWMGGVTDHLSLEAAGATVIPFGVGNSQMLIQTILDLSVDAIHSTPSYPAVLEQTISEHFPGLSPQDLGLRLGLFGGEAGLDNESFRKRLEDTWGYSARNANYGVSDLFSNFASQCEQNNDLHFLGHDVLYAELIDPDDEIVIPWQEGETGELVLTHLLREAQPLVRFRTNDIIQITGTGECACGRTTPRFQVLGRSDDMIVIRGINVYPTAVGGVISSFSELSGEYRIRMHGAGPYDRLNIEAELSESIPSATSLIQDIENSIKYSIRVSSRVELFSPHSFPRTEGKTKRLIRE